MPSVEALVDETVDYLKSKPARDAVRQDPYWPKWDAPWWRMTLLFEMGLSSRIPQSMVETLMSMMQLRYVHGFPTKPGELPAGKDPVRDVLCPCAMGTIHQVLRSCGVPVDEEIPWLRDAMLASQLPDGGLNCDETAYTTSRKSSLTSTLPALEAILWSTSHYNQAQADFLDRGARYLIAHRLCRSTQGVVIDQDWLKTCFPRFYYYDVLRGYTFLFHWAKRRAKPVPSGAVWSVVEDLTGRPLVVERDALEPARRFPLLDFVSRIGYPAVYLRLPG